MAISNVSSGLRPGVCTSTTRPQAPFEGQMIYETDTDLTFIWGGSAWQQVSGGTAVGNSGLVYITGGALSSTATDFVGCFTSAYDNYRIEMTQLNATVGWFSARMLSGTTPLTSNYYIGLPGRTSGGTVVGDSSANANMAYLAYAYQSGGATVCSYDIMTPQKATNTFFQGQYSSLNSSGGTYNFYSGGVAVDNSTAYDGLRILHSGGVTIAGNIRIYGYRQA